MNVRFYNDQVINDVMNSLMQFDRTSLRNALNVCISQIRRPSAMIDARGFIACGILSVIIQNAKIGGNNCPPEFMRSQVYKIAEAIKPSLRWRFFGPGFLEWLNRFNPKEKKFKAINDFEELFLGIVSFTIMENRQKRVVERSFDRFVKNLGFKSFDDYACSANLLVDFERFFTHEPSLYDENSMSEMLAISGFKPEPLILGEESIDNIRLDTIDQNLVPLFFGGRKGIRKGIQWQPLALFNLPVRLCFALPKAQKNILQGASKGTIFEDYLTNVLTGRLIVAVDAEDPIEGHTEDAEGVTNAPRGKDLLNKLNVLGKTYAWHTVAPWKYYLSKPSLAKGIARTSLRLYQYIKYGYEQPPKQLSSNIVIRSETHPSFRRFLEDEKAYEWEEDLVLLHKNEPKHCLIGQAKFTAKYSHNHYAKGADHVKKIVNYIDENPHAKKELEIPLDFPIVPVLLTSFTGAIYNREDGILKTTIYPILQGKFLERISAHLRHCNHGC